MQISLKAKATLLVGVLVVVVFGALGYVRHERLGTELLELQAHQQAALAETVANDLADKLETHLTVLEQSAHRLAALETPDAAPATSRLAAVGAVRALFDGVAIVSLTGDVLEHEPPLVGAAALNIQDREYFQRVLATGRPVISAPILSRSGHGAAVMMAAPVRSPAGGAQAVLVAGLQLQRSNMLGRLGQASVGGSGHFEVVTGGPSPVYVVHRDAGRILTAAPAGPVESSSAAADLVTRTPIRTVGWELRVVLPHQEAFAPVAQARARLWWILAALGLLCAFLTWIGMRWLLDPLTSLRTAMQSLREGADPATVHVDTSATDERGDLAREFRSLLEQTHARQAELTAVIEASPLGLFRCDANGYLTYVNEAYLQQHGLRRDQASDGWLGLVREDIRAQVWQAWQAVASRPQPFSVVRKVRRPDGRSTLLSVRSAPLIFGGRLQGHVGTVADITDQVEAEKALRLLTAIFDATKDYVVQTDSRGLITYMNPAARTAAGLGPDSPVCHLLFSQFHTPATSRCFDEVILPAVKRNGVWVGDTTVYDGQGGEIPVSHTVIAHRDKTGRIDHYSAVMRDISAHVNDQRSLQRQAATLRSVTEAMPAIMAVVGKDQRYRFVNSSFERWCGAHRDGIVGRTLAEVLGRQEAARCLPWVKRVLAGESVNFERHCSDRQGSRHLALSYVPLWLDDGSVDGFVGIGQDITRHRREEDRLLELAHRDVLTGALNRAGFETHLERCLDLGEGAELALLYIDLDHFKPVNDRHGHPVGDEVLRQFAKRLRDAVRPTDVVARLGGDEFAVVLSGVRDLDGVNVVAAKVVALAGAPFEIGDLALRIGASVGVALGLKPGTGWQEFVAQADTMLYEAKRAGRGRHAGLLH